MASSSTPVRPGRYLSLFLVLLVGAYLLVFLTGDKKPEPKLGIDLQGGTRVTLTARTPDGSRPTRESLDLAKRIIENRVDGLGVSGAEVIIDGDNLVITVPGNDGGEVRNVGQTARLYIRPVKFAMPALTPEQVAELEELQKQLSGGLPGGPGAPAGAPADRAPAQPPGGENPPETPADQAPPQPRPFPDEPPAQPAPAPNPSPTPAPSPSPEPGASPSPAPGGPQQPADPKAQRAERIAVEKQKRQSTNQLVQAMAVDEMAQRCGKDEEDVLVGNDDPSLPLVTCSADRTEVFLLEPAIIKGEQIKNATSGLDQQRAQWVVNVEFDSEAGRTWADFTRDHVGDRTAFVLDTEVISAPEIQEPILGGNTQVTGQFTEASARELANQLKYGSLPLSFESSEAETVSATLGLSSLKAGLIAGAVGFALVLLYSLLYYRVLGLLTALSLVASGAMVYAVLVLLGRWIGYTLDLAGVAGLIIGIGTTADSFVVFFERIKDEIREGRSFRSAVPRGWARARKTILSGNAVTFLAAAVLYVLAVGQVKGFAFTLGLTTIFDVLVVFLVTWPLVYLASKSPTMAKPALNGLGAVQQIARERRAAAQATRGK